MSRGPEELETTELDFQQDGDYTSRWGPSDLHPACEKLLREAWHTADLNFKAHLSSSKGESRYATIERVDGATTIRSTARVDDLEDLVDTCIWTAYGGDDYCSGGRDALCKVYDLDPEEDQDEVCKRFDEWCDSQGGNYQEYHCAEDTLAAGATWDELISALDTTEYEAAKSADEFLEAMVESVKQYLVTELLRLIDKGGEP